MTELEQNLFSFEDDEKDEGNI